MVLVGVLLGGVVGTLGRYGLMVLMDGVGTGRFPFGTLLVNVIGSLVMGALVSLSEAGQLVAPAVRIGLMTGVLGSFTTYSTFNQDTLNLLVRGQWGTALVNIGVTVLGCLGAGMLGFVVTRAAM